MLSGQAVHMSSSHDPRSGEAYHQMSRYILLLRYHRVDIMIMPAIGILPPILGMNNGPFLGTKPCTGLLYCNNRHLILSGPTTQRRAYKETGRDRKSSLIPFHSSLCLSSTTCPCLDNINNTHRQKHGLFSSLYIASANQFTV